MQHAVRFWPACAMALAVTAGGTSAHAQAVPPLPGRVDIEAQGTAATGARAAENAVRSAVDAFGTTVGRETIGLYNPESARGFSPTAAGNVRIEGLYFDQVWELGARLQRTTQIRVGLSALGSPFPAPTGIVDYAFRTPGDETALSLLGEINQWGNNSLEIDANLPVQEGLNLGLGGAIYNDRNFNGTRAQFLELSAALLWQITPEADLVPFATHAEGFEIKGPLFLPAGEGLPPRLPRRFLKGPDWARYRGSATNAGLIATWRIAAGWELKGGVFHSRFDDRRGFTNLIVDLAADGTGTQIVIADPPLTFASTSGELRLTRTIADGPRVHRLHASVRARAGNRRFGGSDVIDLGPTSVFSPTTAPRPAFAFSAQQRDRVRQWTVGLAYEGRWQGVGELSLGVQKTQYRKRIGLPGEPPVATFAAPILFNVTLAAEITPRLTAYGGYVTGLEESGIAPENAANRNEALPAIRTSQRDAGLSYALTDEIKLVAGVFDVRKPYFNLGANGRFDALGDVINQGAEVSIAGPLTERLSVVAGAVLLRPRVRGEDVASGQVGPRPVGAITRRLELNADWRPPWLEGLSLDVSASHRSAETATVSNLTAIPPRTMIDLGGRYQFALAGKAATLRLQIENLTDLQGFRLEGAGAFDLIAGRRLGGYLTVDF
ncbi:TonB-dependent receptor [Novosphingobium sp.]|uniref:TonB-dependent receptor domain-containing protein n=1 Tax=Novosphingobium sp. TaxID=1874826 RepID=UPI001D60E53C|nr:TonB-dependent receptor [Novosphingobium sp.]MBX9663313.1 TonB-dependent receptor [Novosphingobium sp.]